MRATRGQDRREKRSQECHMPSRSSAPPRVLAITPRHEPIVAYVWSSLRRVPSKATSDHGRDRLRSRPTAARERQRPGPFRQMLRRVAVKVPHLRRGPGLDDEVPRTSRTSDGRSRVRRRVVRSLRSAESSRLVETAPTATRQARSLLIAAKSRLRARDSTSLSRHVPVRYVTRRVRSSRTEPAPQPAQSARRRLNINWLTLGGPPRSKANTISPTGSHPSSPS